MVEYQADGKELYMVPTDLDILYQADFLAVAQDFASDKKLFLNAFSSAWTALMNADRFSGPLGSACSSENSISSHSSKSESGSKSSADVSA